MNYNELWTQFKAYLHAEIGWYETYNYRPMTGAEFVAEHGAQMSEAFKAFMIDNVQLVNRQCDQYAIFFTGEQIPS
jgi:hypothetical protein